MYREGTQERQGFADQVAGSLAMGPAVVVLVAGNVAADDLKAAEEEVHSQSFHSSRALAVRGAQVVQAGEDDIH